MWFVTSQFLVTLWFRVSVESVLSFVYLIASCYRAIIGIVELLDVRCKVLF